jgi:predicted XRE-type DNA-binding protein
MDMFEKMRNDPIIEHVTPVGGNIFADLGFEPEEAARLLAEADQAISEKLAIKESLMTELAGWIDEKRLKQAEAADILGVTRPRVSDVINKKAIKFTIDALVDMLARTGKHIQLSVR